MKTAIILPRKFKFSEQNPNSIETVVRTINSPLLNNGENDVVVICSIGEESGNQFKTQKFSCLTDGGYVRDITVFLKYFKPDIVEVHQGIELAAKIAAANDIPTIVYRHNFIKRRQGLKAYVTKKQLEKLSSILFVSNSAKQAFDENYSEFSYKSYSMPNPINLEKWHYDNQPKSQTLFFAGRAAPEKGLEELCDGLKLILDEFKDWNATLILGEYQTHQKWANEQIAKLEPFKERINILKNQPLENVIKEEAKAQIAIVPSKFQEPFGLVALEAHSQKCALISSGTGGLMEASGTNAIYLNHVSGEEIYNAAKKLINNPDLRQKIAQDGYDYLLKTHNAKIRANQLNDLREHIIAKFKND